MCCQMNTQALLRDTVIGIFNIQYTIPVFPLKLGNQGKYH